MKRKGNVNVRIDSYRSIEHVPQEVWDSIAPRYHVGLESPHLSAIERSGINDIDPYYLVASDNGRPVGIAYFFLMDIDLSKLGSDISPETRETVKFWDPDFMKFRMLECGLLPALGETIAADNETLPHVLRSVAGEMERIGRKAGASFILIRDIPCHRYGLFKELEEDGFVPVAGFPTATMELRWKTFEDYLTALKGKARRDVRRHMSRLTPEEITVDLIRDFGEYAPHLEHLWTQVSRRAEEYEHERLTASYFREMDRCLPDRSHIIVIRKHGEIAAFCLCLEGDEEYFVSHTGIDYRYNSEYDLYFNLHFRALQEALERNKKRINFGITTYHFKLLIGCELQPLIYFVKHIAEPQFTPALADLFRRSIERPENFHRPFRNQDISERIQVPHVVAELDVSRDKARRDLFDKTRAYVRPDIIRLAGLYSYFLPFESAQEATIQFRNKPVVMLGANSYLGLSTHPEICAAAKKAIDKYGTGCSGSPFLNGTLDIHVDLSRSLAAFMRKDDAILFSTGYQTNLGVISALAGRHDVVIMDAGNHASLIDGTQLCQATVVRYRHNDMKSLQGVLERYPDRAKFIVVDSIFSMEGTMADLQTIVDLAGRYDARLMLDEAHAIGVMGPGGRGVAEHFGLLEKVDIVMGTFSKSFASVGGFVAGDGKVIDYLRHCARSHMFSASLPPSSVATVRKALDIIMEGPERRRKVLRNAAFMARGLQGLGYNAPFQGTAIVPVLCGDELLTLALYKKLLDEGVFVNPVLHPAVPKGRELLRTSYMATHDEEILTRALEIFAMIRTPVFPGS